MKPGSIPRIHPLPEFLAQGQRKVWYDDLKRVIQVPWMGVVTMAFSHYPHFYKALWDGTRGLFASKSLVEACLHNRTFIETEIENLNPACLQPKLVDLGYAPCEISSAALIDAAKQDAPLEEIVAMCRLFQWLLPGLVTNIAYLRAQLILPARPRDGGTRPT